MAKKTCHRHVPIVLTSGSLNLLEPYGPIQACNEIVLHIYIYIYIYIYSINSAKYTSDIAQ
jgi:hypothetical protein